MTRLPLGVIALSDANYVAEGNPHGFVPEIVAGPMPTLGQNCAWWVGRAADLAKGYGCESLTLWTGFGGAATNDQTGFVLSILDAAPGITLADVNACSAAIHTRGLRAGIGVSPLQVVQGVNRPRWDASNPVGTLLFEMSLAQANGFDDAYVDSLRGECMAVDPAALAPERFGQVPAAFPGSRLLVEFYAKGYPANVLHWRDSAETFTNDRPQGVELEPDDVKGKAQQAAWGKRLRDTGSTVILNCRPDDPTLPGRQKNILAAWRASQAK